MPNFFFDATEEMIPLNELDLDIDSLRDKIVGAGILPFTYCPSQKKVYILLGKERYVTNWKGSLKWSGFEGGRKFEEDVEETAAREFVEESMGVIRLDDHNPTSTIHNVVQFLKKKKYAARILLCIDHGDTDKRYQVTYLVQVPLHQSCRTEFSHIRNTFMNIHAKLLHFKRIFDALPSADEVFVMEDQIVDGKKVKALVNVTLTSTTLMVEYLSDDGMCLKEHDISQCPRRASLDVYCKWFCMRKQINSYLCELNSIRECVNVKRNCLGFFVHATLNEEYIEKQQIHWWSLDSLKQVIQNGGYQGNDFFRAYFLPVLQRSIQEIEKRMS